MFVKKIILATHNLGKVRELQGPLAQLGYSVELLPPNYLEAEENGSTFLENAQIKAQFYAEQTGLPCLADDSGLEVDALGGLPGIYSARFADQVAPIPNENRDQRNIRKLLAELAAFPPPYPARFHCAMAMYFDPQHILTSEGVWEGKIILHPHGSNGFGYDPVFVDALSGQTAACLSPEQKFCRSHRGKALAGLFAQLGQKT